MEAVVEPLGRLNLSSTDIQLITLFHRYVVATILSPGMGLEWGGVLPAPLLVPLLGTEPDLNICRKVSEYDTKMNTSKIAFWPDAFYQDTQLAIRVNFSFLF